MNLCTSAFRHSNDVAANLTDLPERKGGRAAVRKPDENGSTKLVNYFKLQQHIHIFLLGFIGEETSRSQGTSCANL